MISLNKIRYLGRMTPVVARHLSYLDETSKCSGYLQWIGPEDSCGVGYVGEVRRAFEVVENKDLASCTLSSCC